MACAWGMLFGFPAQSVQRAPFPGRSHRFVNAPLRNDVQSPKRASAKPGSESLEINYETSIAAFGFGHSLLVARLFDGGVRSRHGNSAGHGNRSLGRRR